MATFTSLDDWARKRGESLDKVVKGTMIELFSGIITATRVDTGRMAGNWQLVRSDTTRVLERLDPTYSLGQAEVRKVDAEGVWYFVNNVEYAGYWEERDGMVMRNVFRVDQIVRNSVREHVS